VPGRLALPLERSDRPRGGLSRTNHGTGDDPRLVRRSGDRGPRCSLALSLGAVRYDGPRRPSPAWTDGRREGPALPRRTPALAAVPGLPGISPGPLQPARDRRLRRRAAVLGVVPALGTVRRPRGRIAPSVVGRPRLATMVTDRSRAPARGAGLWTGDDV